MLRFADSTPIGENEHRFGWPFALAALTPLLSRSGMLFDHCVERTFLWPHREHHNSFFYKEPWIAVIHNPPYLPAWYLPTQQLPVLLNNRGFVTSKQQLKLVIVLGDNLKDYLKYYLDAPIEVIKLPSGIPTVMWDPIAFLKQPDPALIQLGWYCRNTMGIYHCRVPAPFTKVHLWRADKQQQQIHELCRLNSNRRIQQHTRRMHHVNDYMFDQMFSKNVAFMEVFDAVANNGVVDCIARNTPLVINYRPGVAFYLGEDYPLYFRNINEVESLLTTEKILQAHEYLKQMDKSWLSGESFKNSVKQACFKHIPRFQGIT